MELAYVCGPYRATTGVRVAENIRQAEAAALALWRRGYAVICPHKNTALLGGSLPDAVWLEGDLVMLRRCDLVVLVGEWWTSTGAQGEIAEAKRLGIPVRSLAEVLEVKP